ncbi:MAG: polysaccharide deacetylase family protein [Clostridia bacterium]|nr:polysaccharide deacetylase family protein [Clostridia bacterium]
MAIMLSLSFIGALTLTQTSVTANTAGRKLPIYCVETNEKKIAVTFDAAWSAEDTDKLIEILKKHNAKATVFVVGDWVRANPDAVKKFYQAGHEIGNHSDTHAAFSQADREKIKEEIENCNAEIEKITGFKPKILRVPSGDYDNKSIEVTESLGMKMIQWDVDSLDWKKLSVDEMYNRVIEKTQNGSIILFHNGVENTPEALDKILTELEKDGYKFVTISELIYWDDYEIDHTGRQIKTKTINT